ncbi:MAG: GGDEF domain-containing protein, partial [Candidatus Sumerlaeia bacterium]|nr:GGDEF domain-containing protein [Candidatus Sumerlaeia bacterium]
DITERRLAEEATRETEEQYRMMIDAMGDAIHMVDENLRIILINKSLRDWNKKLGFPSEVIGHTPFEIYPFLSERIREEYQRVFATGKTLITEETQTLGGREIITETRKIPILEENKVIRVVTVIRDITEQKRLEEELRALSLVDDLTGLYNRRGFFTLAQQQLKLAARLKRNTVLLFSDIDNLKVINDTFGHPVGDQALKEMAHILKRTFRESDIIARLGGDEFVVLAVEVNNDANTLIQRLLNNLKARNAQIKAHPPSPPSPVYELSVSIGIACCSADTPCSLDDLLLQADKNMYEQKRHKQTDKG